MSRLLLTWSDRVSETRPARRGRSTGKRTNSPVLQFLDAAQCEYDEVWVLSERGGLSSAEALCEELSGAGMSFKICPIRGAEFAEYDLLFEGLLPIVSRVSRERLRQGWEVDVFLSAGSEPVQTIWAVLALSGMLPARMFQLVAASRATEDSRAVEVKLKVDKFPGVRALESEVAKLRSRLRRAPYKGQSQAWEGLLVRSARVAASDVPLVIQGESGAGKHWLAREVHQGSFRSAGPYIAENCAAFEADSGAEQLFGYEGRGLSSQESRRPGLLEQAHGGTLVLGNVEQLTPRVQATLVRVLQDGKMRAVGGSRELEVDVRVIAACQCDLVKLVARGEFRQDLYFLLSGACLKVPPLRERKTDIVGLVREFLDEVRSGLELTGEVLERLEEYQWPGNIRELRAEVVRWTVFSDGVVTVADLSLAPPESLSDDDDLGDTVAAEQEERGETYTLAEAVEHAEITALQYALHQFEGNLSQTARSLDIDRNTLKRKLKKYSLRGFS